MTPKKPVPTAPSAPTVAATSPVTKDTDVVWAGARPVGDETRIRLADGEAVRGVYLGATSIAIGGRPVTVHRLRCAGQECSMLGSAVLDSRLAGIEPGTEIVIARRGTTRTRAGRTAIVYAVGVVAARTE